MDRTVLAACLVGVFLMVLTAIPILAQERMIDLDIPGQPLSSAIRALSERADIQVLYVEKTVRGLRSEELRGRYTVAQALDRMLEGSGLDHIFTAPGTVAIRSLGNPGAGGDASAGALLEDVHRKLDLGTIVVSNTGNPLHSLPASTTVIRGEDILDRSPLLQGVDIVRGVPGLQVSTLNQGGLRERFIIRGFASAGEAVASYLDGVPLNESNGHSDGTIDLATMIPEELDRIEIIRSPVSALYGNFSRSGSINFITRNRVDEAMAHFTLGAWNTRRAALTLGRVGERLSQYYAVDSYYTDGFRENSKTVRGNMSARWTYDLSPSSAIRFGGRSYAGKWDAPGYLTQAEWEAGEWKSSNTDVDAGEKKRYDIHFNFNHTFSDADSLGATVFVYNTDFHRWRHNGVLQAEEHNVLTGVMGKLLYSKRGSFISSRDELLLGVDLLQEDGLRRTWDNPVPWTRELLTAEGDYYQRSYSAYGQLEMKPLPPMTIVLGFRHDYFDLSLDQSGIDAGQSTGVVTNFRNDMHAFSPKSAISWDFSPRYTVYGNLGKGFYLPAMFDKFLNDDLGPVTLNYWEAGLRFRPAAALRGSVALFRIDAKGDVTREGGPFGPLVNAGDVRRQGVELDFESELNDALTLFGSASWIDAEFRNYVTAGADLSGNVPTEVPPWFFSAGADYFHASSQIGVRATVQGKGGVWLSNENLFRYGSYTYLDAQAYLRRGPYTFDVKLGNLTDRRYAEYAFSGTEPGSQRYGPARPFNVSVSMSARF